MKTQMLNTIKKHILAHPTQAFISLECKLPGELKKQEVKLAKFNDEYFVLSLLDRIHPGVYKSTEKLIAKGLSGKLELTKIKLKSAVVIKCLNKAIFDEKLAAESEEEEINPSASSLPKIDISQFFAPLKIRHSANSLPRLAFPLNNFYDDSPDESSNDDEDESTSPSPQSSLNTDIFTKAFKEWDLTLIQKIYKNVLSVNDCQVFSDETLQLKLLKIPFFEGIDLNTIIVDRERELRWNSAQTYSFKEKFSIIKQLIEVCSRFERNGFINADLNPNNIIVHKSETDPIINMIDLEFCREKTNNAFDFAVGTELYMAPELLHPNKNDEYVFTSKSTVYLIGLIIGFLFKEGKECFHTPELKDYISSSLDSRDSPILSLTEKEDQGAQLNLASIKHVEIKALVKDMTQDDPTLRPTIAECLVRFSLISAEKPLASSSGSLVFKENKIPPQKSSTTTSTLTL